MKNSFEEFYEMLKLDRKNSSWSRENTLKSRIKELEDEVEEIRKAIENNDLKNLKEELGDALWDLLFLIVLAEEKGISPQEIIEDAKEKLKRRKPWIFEGKELSKEEESRRWKETKRIEKEKGLR